LTGGIDLKAFAKLSKKYRLLSLLLVLLLAVSNMAFSAHVSSHLTTDSGLCSLCIHPGGPDTAIANENRALFPSTSAQKFKQIHYPIRFLSFISHIHQSRAPPRFT
jgi:hypothetical protein